MRVTCERCLRRYDVPDATVKGRKIRARCKCGARVIVQDEERAARSSAGGGQTTGSIQRPVRWFVDITSWEPIAMDLRQLVRAFDGGRIDADTLVWRKGMPDWRRLRDVAELAERLMGADAGGKSAAPEAQTDTAAMASEPPPRQPERSRTPPASYSVGESDEHAARKGLVAEDGASPVYSAPAEYTERSPVERFSSGSPAALPAVGGRGEQSRSAEPELAAGHGEVRSLPPRTITQTGLSAPPPEPPRAALSPAVPEIKVIDADSEGRISVSPSAAAQSPRPREVRSNTPAAGQRRTPNSDETPAQKPSSISVPPGALAAKTPRMRRRYVAAGAGVAILGALLLHGALSVDSSSSASVAPAAEQHAGSAAANAPDVQSRQGALAPVPAVPNPAVSDSVAAGSVKRPAPPASLSGASAAGLASKVGSGVPVPRKEGAPAPASVAALSGSAANKVGAPVSGTSVGPVAMTGLGHAGSVGAPPASQARANTPSDAAAKPAHSEPGMQHAQNGVAVAGNALGSGTGEQGKAPISASPAPSAPVVSHGVASGSPGQKPASVPAPGSASPSAANPPPFDGKVARQQLEIAALKAATCGKQGPTRGAGEVSVTIESWGRVVRVTHLNPAFVDTPVGLCVTQAFQQIQVPRFSGGPESLSGAFVVQ